MPSVAIVDLIIGLVLIAVSYMFSSIFVGYIQARIARYFGDPTAVEEGFLSCNPLVYWDPMGFVAFLLIGIGWGRQFPFRAELIEAPLQTTKIFIVQFAKPVLLFGISVMAMLANIALLGPGTLIFTYQYGLPCLSCSSIPIQKLAESVGNGVPGYLLLISALLVVTASINIFFALWEFLRALCAGIFFHISCYRQYYQEYEDIVLIFGPLLLFQCCGQSLYYVLIRTTAFIIVTIYGL